MKGLILVTVLLLLVSCQKNAEVNEILNTDGPKITRQVVKDTTQEIEMEEVIEENLPPSEVEFYLTHNKEISAASRYAFINVSIRKAEGIRAYQFRINYDPEILTVASYVESDFMKQKDGDQTLKIIEKTNNSYFVAVTTTGEAYGDGVLGFFTVLFNGKGESKLDLNNTDLVNVEFEQVRHSAVDSSIVVT